MRELRVILPCDHINRFYRSDYRTVELPVMNGITPIPIDISPMSIDKITRTPSDSIDWRTIDAGDFKNSSYIAIIEAGTFPGSPPEDASESHPEAPATIDAGWFTSTNSEWAREEIVYRENVDYTLDIKSRKIEWLRSDLSSNEDPSVTVSVTGLFNFYSNKSYFEHECPVCYGQGWFTDILNTRFETFYVEGTDKLVQEYTKALLTNMSEDQSYGSEINSMVGKTFGSVEDLIDSFASTVINSEALYKDIQSKASSDGIPIPDDEVLDYVEIEHMSVVRENMSVSANLRIFARSGNQGSFKIEL